MLTMLKQCNFSCWCEVWEKNHSGVILLTEVVTAKAVLLQFHIPHQNKANTKICYWSC